MSLDGLKFKLLTPSDENKAHQDATPADGDFDGESVGFESNSLARSVNLIEVTNKDSDNNREYLPGAGTKMTDFSGNGKLQDNALTDSLRQTADAVRARWFRVVQTDNSSFKLTGLFLIESFNVTGAHDGAVDFDISLKSHKEVTVTY